jgi:integrase/recombinase XerD
MKMNVDLKTYRKQQSEDIFFADKYFMQFAGSNLKCSEVTQDLINEYILYLKDKFKPQTVNLYIFKVSPVVKYGIKRGYIKDDISFTHLVEQEHISLKRVL